MRAFLSETGDRNGMGTEDKSTRESALLLKS